MTVKQLQKAKSKNIRGLLSTATGCLLGASTVVQAQSEAGWETDVAVLIYNETDRVSAFEPAISFKKTYDDDSVLGIKLVYDALTGASHNGAAVSDEVQTFTRPSGNGSYATQSADVPLDDTFRDSRGSASMNYEQPLNRFDKVIYGGNVSAEHDFTSMSGSVSYLHDLNQRNTTLSAGISFEYDQITPEGGVPVALSEMQVNTNPQVRAEDSETRTMTELLLGVTQVIDRNTLVQMNYGFSQSSGYHSDPYKIVSVLNADGSLDAANGLNGTYIYENRPDSRTKQSLYVKAKRYMQGNIADISYRYMWDDWDVSSHTIDTHYRFNMESNWYIEPHVRYYQQQAAEFYRYSLSNTEVVPEFVSADYRLGDMTAITVGAKLGFKVAGHANSVRLEFYQQSGDETPSEVDSLILQYNYQF
ncbi:DUF3570 domain-containing protein [Oceaniserpentilla sp. 4NH20-0058]|uniref:DUF3570 domain-containing protein n=1 Tax=Oceaniserpentilla sp. 4NH20-0058 TaxID=3127660 RepID=UPI003102ED44